MAKFTPQSGDIIWLNFNPQAGHEQAGFRPALVISEMPYNKKTGLAVCCPITRTVRNNPFEVQIEIEGITSVVLSDQIKSIDLKARKAKPCSAVDYRILAEVRSKIKALIGIS
jgi:mRNA interferase MazF